MNRIVPLVLLALVCLTPALAGEPGLFGGFEWMKMRPTQTSPDFVVVDPDTDNHVEGDIKAVDVDRGGDPRLTIGYRWADGGEVRFRCWRFADNGSRREESGGGVLWDILSPSDTSFGGFQGSASGTLKIKGKLYEMIYRRTFQSGEKVQMRFGGGLRYIEFQSDLDVYYDNGARVIHIGQGGLTKGTGVLFSAQSMVRLGGRFHLGGEAALGFHRGSTLMTFVAQGLDALPAYNVRRSNNRNTATMDGALWIDADLGQGLVARLGYQFSRWSNVAEGLRFPDDINPAMAVEQTADAHWDGLTFGLGYRW